MGWGIQMSTRHHFTSPVRIHRAADFGRKHALMLSAGAVALMSLPAGQALAQVGPNTLPTGGVATSGDATINTAGATTTVNQVDNRVVIDWDTFNIGENATVNFNQPGATSIAIN